MMTIRTTEDLRLAYSIAWFAKGMNRKVYDGLMKDIRKFNNKPEPAIKRTYFANEFDTCIEKIVFPEGTTQEEADKYFMNECYSERPNSQYDCTGKIFTDWVSKFIQDGRIIIYQRLSMDV